MGASGLRLCRMEGEMTATEIELRAEVLGLRGLVAQLDKQAKENRDLADSERS